MSISTNIQQITHHIPKEVMLVAVSKTKPNELLLEAYQAGQRHFGENYVQELVDKQATLPQDIHWHFIGHLQSNKAKYIVPFVYLIHSVDSLKLLVEINKQAEKIHKTIDCLLQIYIAKEETKFGFDIQECEALLQSEAIKTLKNIRIAGLMGMASNTDNIVQLTTEFNSIKQLFDNIKSKKLVGESFKYLSIGMSSDYPLAIECGSNMIRVGSHIFGERVYNSPLL